MSSLWRPFTIVENTDPGQPRQFRGVRDENGKVEKQELIDGVWREEGASYKDFCKAARNIDPREVDRESMRYERLAADEKSLSAEAKRWAENVYEQTKHLRTSPAAMWKISESVRQLALTLEKNGVFQHVPPYKRMIVHSNFGWWSVELDGTNFRDETNHVWPKYEPPQYVFDTAETLFYEKKEEAE